MPGESVDGQEVEAVYERTAAAIGRARSGGGPSLLEMKTYRYRGHSRSDPARYRPPGELEAWRARDPIELLGRRLEQSGALDADRQAQLRRDVQQRIDAAAERASTAPWPDPTEDISRYVYAN
jgi:TPP-dependent pyruvate/acetoin dehydrogenase alpha subunit